jgi:SAM-dependent methyltransferase
VATDEFFAFHIAPDPTLLLRNPIVFKTGRLIPRYRNLHPIPPLPTIGSFGFATSGKGFERLITEVQQAFDRAVIRLSIPPSAFFDLDGSRGRDIAEHCRSLVVKPGIRLEVHHEFLSDEQLLDFLAQNSLNAFFYEHKSGRGISSVIDYALAVERPIAVTKSSMFRHISGSRPPITIEDSTLSEIMSHGFGTLARFYEEWTPENLVWDYERIVGAVLAAVDIADRNKSPRNPRYLLRTAARRMLSSARHIEAILNQSPTGARVVRSLKPNLALKKAVSLLRATIARNTPLVSEQGRTDWVPTPAESAVPGPQLGSIPRYEPNVVRVNGLNRILDQAAARAYQPAIDYLFRYMPEIMVRKIPAANIQQAFVLDTVVRLLAGKSQPAILSIGSYEDTAAGCLLRSGYFVEEVDPLLNYDLATYVSKPTCKRSSFDAVFATSVIEHVADDAKFLRDIEDLLAPGGVGVLTCDFNDQYHPGDRIPGEDRRLYTRRDILDRLMPLLPRCELTDPPQWDCPNPDFTYGGCRYTFASLVFRRIR